MLRNRVRRPRQWLRITAACCILVIASAACSSSGSSRSSSGSSSGAASGGTLFVNSNFVKIASMDPQTVIFGPESAMFLGAMYSTLVTFDQASQSYAPSLASSWSFNSDATSLSLTLRTGPTFADGKPVTAANVVFTIDRFVNIKGPNSEFLPAGTTATASGQDNVTIKTPQPDPGLLASLSSPFLGILEASAVEAAGGVDNATAATGDKADATFFQSKSAGSGPYVPVSFSSTTKIELVARSDYWGPKPAFSHIIINNVPAQTQFLDVQRDTDEIDMDLTPMQAQSISPGSNAVTQLVPAANTFYLELNMAAATSPTTANTDIQQAIRYGLDYKSLLSIAGAGSAQAPGIVVQGVPGSLPLNEALTQDLAKAEADVAAAKQAGLSDPHFTLSYPSDFTSQGVNWQTLAEAIQASLGQIGINVTLSGSPLPVWLAAWNAGKLDASISQLPLEVPDPSSYIGFLPGGPYAVRANWNTGAAPSVSQLGNQALTEVNATQRSVYYQDLQRMLNTQGPLVSLFYPTFVVAHTSDLADVTYNPVYDGYELAIVRPK